MHVPPKSVRKVPFSSFRFHMIARVLILVSGLLQFGCTPALAARLPDLPAQRVMVSFIWCIGNAQQHSKAGKCSLLVGIEVARCGFESLRYPFPIFSYILIRYEVKTCHAILMGRSIQKSQLLSESQLVWCLQCSHRTTMNLIVLEKALMCGCPVAMKILL